jgi:hypothetical protein
VCVVKAKVARLSYFFFFQDIMFKFFFERIDLKRL